MTQCPRCRLDIEQKLVGGSLHCDVTECTECGYERHIGDCTVDEPHFHSAHMPPQPRRTDPMFL